MFQIFAARARNWLRTSCEACITAIPVAKHTRLPPVTSVKPTLSVSPTLGRTRSTGMFNSSATICACDAREPPMSGLPVITAALPSLSSVTMALELKPALNQKPAATPRP